MGSQDTLLETVESDKRLLQDLQLVDIALELVVVQVQLGLNHKPKLVGECLQYGELRLLNLLI